MAEHHGHNSLHYDITLSQHLTLRYLNLSELVPPGDVSHLYDTDNLNALTTMKTRNPVPPTTQENSKPGEQASVSFNGSS